MSNTALSRLPKYRHYKPKNLAVVRIDGRDHYLGPYGTEASHEKYRRLIAQWLAGTPLPTARDPRDAKDSGPSVSEIILAYLQWADGYYLKNGKPTREPVNIRLAMRALRRLYGLTPARQFGPRGLKAVRQTLVEANLSRNEVNRRVRYIVRLFKWAVENEQVEPSVYQGLKAVSGLRKGRSEARETAPVKPVDDSMVEPLRPHVARQIWAMIELQRLTGMRPGEVCLMRTCDLNMSGSVWSYRPESHKTEHHGRDRIIFLGPRAQEVLKPWLKVEPMAYLFSPREAMEEWNAERRRHRKSPMTPSQRSRTRQRRPRKSPGEKYTTESYRRAIAYGCQWAFPHPILSKVPRSKLTPEQRSELKRWNKVHCWHPNRLRHSAATRIRASYGLEAAQTVLGHASADVTTVYAERDHAAARVVMSEIG